MIANREIRQNANFALQGNRARVLFAVILGGLISGFVSSLILGFATSETAQDALSVIIGILFAPITSMGVALIALKVVRGEGGTIGDLFTYVRSGKRYLSAMIVSALFSLPTTALGIVIDNMFTASIDVVGLTNALSEAAASSTMVAVTLNDYVHFQALAVTGVWLALIPILLIALAWVYARLSLVCYLFVRSPEKHPFDHFGASFVAMRGHCWQMIRLMLGLFIRYALVSLIPTACATAAVLVGDHSQVLALTLLLACIVACVYFVIYSFRTFLPRSVVYPAAFANALMGELPERPELLEGSPNA